MELQYNRRMLLLNQDVPFSTSISPDIEPPTTTNNNNNSLLSPPPSVFGSPLHLPSHPIISSNVAYAFVIFFTALFFLGFIILYLRQSSRDDSSSSPSRSSRCKRVDPAVAEKSLTALSYHRGDIEKQQQGDDCAICLEELREGEKVKMIVYCKHVFHPECIDAWLAAHVTCPICRCNKLRGERVGDEHGCGGESRAEEEERREVGSQSQSGSDEGRRRSGSTVTVALRRTLGCCL